MGRREGEERGVLGRGEARGRKERGDRQRETRRKRVKRV